MHYLKTVKNDFSKLEIDRINLITTATANAYKSIYLNANYKIKDSDIVREINGTFASIQREQSEYASSNEFLSFFYQNSNKWLLLNHVIFRSSAGLVTYQESLIKIIKASSKTIQSYIAQAIKKGLFVNLPPSIEKIEDNKIVNIRPSTDLAIAFIEFNALTLKKNLDIILKFGDEQQLTNSFKEKNIYYPTRVKA